MAADPWKEFEDELEKLRQAVDLAPEHLRGIRKRLLDMSIEDAVEDPVLVWLEELDEEGMIRWASPEALIARRRSELTR